MKKKLLVFGISGLTGSKIAQIASSNFEVFGTYNSREVNLPNCQIFKQNITEFDKVSKTISEIKPDYIVNTTALHNVDFCEENPKISNLVNSEAVQFMSSQSTKIGARFVHISTDYVFGGIHNHSFSETDIEIPENIYGKSKLDGEKHVLKNEHSVVRPSVVYGWTPLETAESKSSSGKPMNFALWVLMQLNKKNPLKIVADQFATATLADSLANSILKILQSSKSGLYHVSGLSCESRYDFTVNLAREFGYDEKQIQPTDSSQFKQKAKRPLFSCLNCSKAIKEFDLELYDTKKALQIMKSQVEKEAPELLGS